MEEKRPNPEDILARVRRDEERSREGQLKIFFGAAPGVGKTYAMLDAARQKRDEGVDVVVGIAESHGRKETEALLSGLDILPRRELEYRGTKLKEFDLDAALARKPSIILVDELAHTNAPGCRHKKRWQDIYELLGAGINVYTTLNVQHLESLNDVVSQITGVSVRETVPDFLLDRADDLELIDLPPEDLLKRLREGKVYVPELVSRARENFFRKGNLLALRELALRRTAESVDEQMRDYRLGKGVREVWPAGERILVCVGPNPRSIRLIRAGKRMAVGLRSPLIAVYVEAPHKVKPSDNDLRQLDEHMRLAESLGAETVTLSGHKASDEILHYARSINATKILIGKPTHPKWKDKVFGSMLDDIVRGSGEIDVYVITGDTGEPLAKHIAKPASRPTPDWKEWITALAAVAVTTGIAFVLFPYFTPVDVAMLYLLGIVSVSSRAGKGPSILTTVLSVLAFDFFFVPPRYTFAVSEVKYFFTFIVMFVVALVISGMTLRIRRQAESSGARERRTAALYSLSRELVHERGIDRTCIVAIRRLSELFSCHAVILVPDEHGKLSAPVIGPEAFVIDQNETGVAQWAFDHRQEAGLGTDTLSGAKALYIPLTTSSRTVGVLGVMPSSESGPFDHDQIHVLESFANQIAMAVDRTLLAQEAQQALIRAEAEALRSTLLSSVSHDLRTPLAAITGAATALLERDIELSQQARQELVRTIQEEAERLNQIIKNVLDMTRLEAKAINLKKEWQSIEEIVGVVLNRMSERLKGRQINVNVPADLPLVPFDPLLIEQTLMNLMDNALKYTPAGTPIDLQAGMEGEKSLFFEVADRGPGIPPGEEEKIFDKFVHGAGGGIGLGLAICDAIISAHGGRIWAENRPEGGAAFRFTLPVGKQPPLPEPERAASVSDQQTSGAGASGAILDAGAMDSGDIEA
ncbi:MAG: sensor histidine kinase KdpD [Nitrospiraceae bacterium]|nr:sensor histidine kinase KdpD [Nitrospiraceae bacterium]